MGSRRVLFLCTGNYYRSRFAEELFNALAVERGLAWRADSRALIDRLDSLVDNVGPVSPLVVEGLRDRGHPRTNVDRYPCVVLPEDLARFERIVAVHEAEHRPMIESRLAAHADRVEYWHVPDTGELDPRRALDELDRQVRNLIEDCAVGWRP